MENGVTATWTAQVTFDFDLFHTGAPDPQLPDNVGVTSLAGQYTSPPWPDGKGVHWKWNLTAG